MKKQRLFTMNKLWMVVLLLLVNTGCTEDVLSPGENGGNNTEKFFSSTAPESPDIKKIKDDLRAINSKEEFVSKIVDAAGYPRWDKAIVLSSPPLNKGKNQVPPNLSSVYIIPLVSETERRVTGTLTAYAGDVISYRLSFTKDHASYGENQAGYVTTMMQLDAMVYGYTNFGVHENEVFPNTKKVMLREKNDQQKASNQDDPCDIMEVWYDPDGDDIDPEHNSGNEIFTGIWFYRDPVNCRGQMPVFDQFIESGGGSYTIPNFNYQGGGAFPYTPGSDMAERYDYLVREFSLDGQQQNWLVNRADVIRLLYDYLYGHFTLSRRNVGIWAVNYLMQHPFTNLTTFENHYLGYGENADQGYDILFWEDPNNTFPQQSLPTWADFQAAFPSHTNPNYNTSQKMFASIGGAVYSIGYTDSLSNTCAIRLSKALNYSGVTIPHIPTMTFLGGDNKYYFLGAANMIAWMKQTFPNGFTKYTNADGGPNGINFPGSISNKKGIYGMIPNWPGYRNGNGFNASGHVDLLNNSRCDGGCFFSATGGVYEIYIWELQ